MNTSRPHHAWSELAVRENDGLAVSHLWSRTTSRVKVAVDDAWLDERFEIDVPQADALAAFNHPFAYPAGARRLLRRGRLVRIERRAV